VRPLCRCVYVTVVGLIMASGLAAAADDAPENDQAMVTTPEELVKLVSDASFLPPVDLEARIAAAAALVVSQSRPGTVPYAIGWPIPA